MIDQKKSFLCVAVFSLLVFQFLYLSQNFDAYILVLNGDVEGWRAVFGQFGNLAKLGVLQAFILLLLLKDRLLPYWRALVSAMYFPRSAMWLLPQLAAFAITLIYSRQIFSETADASSLSVWVYTVWLVAAFACFVFWLLMFASLSRWLGILIREKNAISITIISSLLVWILASYTKTLWGPMSELTFLLSSELLHFVNPELVYIDAEAKHLGLGEFIVAVAPACSGYEGVGLVLAFTALYLYLYKTEFRFPKAFLLFPLGAIIIWLLNVVRISILVSIGHYWSPEVAVGGFHSQAGWITFILTSMGLLWLARASNFFSIKAPKMWEAKETVPSAADSSNSVPAVNMAMASLIPLVVLLAVMLLSSAIKSGFDWLYPLRVVATCIALYFCWSELNMRPYTLRIEALAAGVFVAVFWGFMLVGTGDDYNLEVSAELNAAPAWMAGLWLFFRFVGSAITVPIAEELAFRTYALCKLTHVDVNTRGAIPLSIVAIALSSLAFGALHGAWLAGTLAGIVYAVVRIRSEHIGDAIAAHAVTNGLLFAYACYSGEWVML